MFARDHRISTTRRLRTGGGKRTGHGHMARCEVITEVLRKIKYLFDITSP